MGVITDLDMDTTDIPMLTTERGLLMLSQRLMPIPTSCTEDTMDLDTMVLDMDTTDIPMLTMARGLLMLMLSPRLMLIPTSCMVGTMDLDTMVLAMDIPMLDLLTTDKLLTKEKEVPAVKEKNSHPNLLLKRKSVSVLELI